MTDPTPPKRSPFIFFLLFLAVFGGGIMFDRAAWFLGPYKRQPPGLGKTFDPFWEAWHLVQQHYVDQSAVQPVRMTEGAIAGMLASLGDVGHTTYLSPKDVERLQEGLKGQLLGIGARISIRGGRPTILQTMPDSPARKAGIQPGDVIAAVDDQPVDQLSLTQLVEKVRGPAGTEVKLSVQRQGTVKPIEFTITRAQVKIPEVVWHPLPGTPFAHLAIHEFGEKTDAELRSALDEIKKQGSRGLILDLRGNPGGLKDQAVAVTSEFLRPGQAVFIEVDAQGNRKEIPTKPGGVAQDIPLCVLTDEGSASSAEILAGALQDHGRAKLVGTKTFGTGTVLEAFPLSDGSAVLLAVARWLTPKGHEIWHKGITPDVTVSLPPDAQALLPDMEEGLTAEALKKSEDKQLLEGLKVLGQVVEGKDGK